ncbi:MAG TPA: hypothetical protein GXZ52_00255 [Clostridiales bacterium]|nr:hypothetical protein [Clostridiales bacterium]
MNPGKGFKTPSGKLEFVSSVLERYAALSGHEALPVYHDWRDIAGLSPEYPFILSTGARRAHLFHSRTYRLSWLSGLENHTQLCLPVGKDYGR